MPLHSPARFRVEVWFSPGAARGALEERAAAFMATATHVGAEARKSAAGAVGVVGAGEELPAAARTAADGSGGDGGGGGGPGSPPDDALEAERHAVPLAPLTCLNAGPDAGGEGLCCRVRGAVGCAWLSCATNSQPHMLRVLHAHR